MSAEAMLVSVKQAVLSARRGARGAWTPWWSTAEPVLPITRAQIEVCWQRRRMATGPMVVAPAGPPYERGSHPDAPSVSRVRAGPRRADRARRVA